MTYFVFLFHIFIFILFIIIIIFYDTVLHIQGILARLPLHHSPFSPLIFLPILSQWSGPLITTTSLTFCYEVFHSIVGIGGANIYYHKTKIYLTVSLGVLLSRGSKDVYNVFIFIDLTLHQVKIQTHSEQEKKKKIIHQEYTHRLQTINIKMSVLLVQFTAFGISVLVYTAQGKHTIFVSLGYLPQLVSLTIMVSSCIHLVIRDKISFIFMAKQYSTVCIFLNPVIH